MARITIETVFENADEEFLGFYVKRLKEQKLPIDFDALSKGEKVMFRSKDPSGKTWARTFYQIVRSPFERSKSLMSSNPPADQL